MIQPRFSALFALAAFAATAPANVLFHTGFETAEGYTVGALDGQEGWLADDTTGTRVATSMNGVDPSSGSQMVAYDSGTLAGEVFYSWVDLTTLWANRPANQNQLAVSVDVYIPAATENVFDIGLTIWGFDTAYSYLGEVDLSTDIDAVRLYDANAASTDSTTGFLRGQWNRLGFVADWDTGVLSAILNGTTVAETTTFDNAGAPLADVDLSVFSLNESAVNTVFFDNYTVEAVPEPATLAALAVGGAALLRRRK